MITRNSEIRNGVPYTHGDTELLTDLPKEDQEKVLVWITQNLYPRKTPLSGYSSYGMKHPMTSTTGIYVTNNQFKHAMMLCGFIPVDERELNWHFCISKRSPFFAKHERCIRGIRFI